MSLPESLAQQLAKEFVIKATDAPVSAQCDAFSKIMKAILELNMFEPTIEGVLAAFCGDCIVKEMDAEVWVNDLLCAYKEWAKPRGHTIFSKHYTLKFLTANFGEPISGGRVYSGIRLKH